MRAEHVDFDEPFAVVPLRSEDESLGGLSFVRIRGERLDCRCRWIRVMAMEGSRLWIPGDMEVIR